LYRAVFQHRGSKRGHEGISGKKKTGIHREVDNKIKSQLYIVSERQIVFSLFVRFPV